MSSPDATRGDLYFHDGVEAQCQQGRHSANRAYSIRHGAQYQLILSQTVNSTLVRNSTLLTPPPLLRKGLPSVPYLRRVY